MKLSIIGTGYVGLVAGTCFAEYGNDVVCVDAQQTKIDNLKKGILPIYEPGLEELVERNHRGGRLHFSTDLAEAIRRAEIVFIAVGTPGLSDGRPDISMVLAVAEEIGRHANGPKIIVNKSTVPVGMAGLVQDAAEKHAKHALQIVSNPEFLREGLAIDDFMYPERVVIGSGDSATAETMTKLYAPFVKRSGNPILIMSVESAELTKYACNSFLAVKITFANTIANLCDALGASYTDVKRGMATDSRIGKQFLNAGIGYGGSCFPKDVRALIRIGGDAGVELPLLEEADKENESQKLRLYGKIANHYKGADSEAILSGRKFAVWGLAFKPGTDDMREAPSIVLIRKLIESGAEIAAYDPEARETAGTTFGNTISYGSMYDILDNADALLILTEWSEFTEPDFENIQSKLKEFLIFDGRNIYDPELMKSKGCRYYGIGTGI